MAISNDSSWTMTRDAIIQAAYRKIGVVSDGATATSTQLTNAAEALNNIIFSLYAQGMPVWAMTTAAFNPVLGKASYSLGLAGADITMTAPLKITQAWSRDSLSNTDIPMNIYTQYNYNLLSTKTNEGYPVQLWYQPLNQTGTITIWPTPDAYTVAHRMVYFVYQRPFSQFDVGTDTPDFPQVWLEPLIYSLAHRLSPEFGLPITEQDKLMETANTLVSNALSFGTEEGSFFIQPDWVVMGMGHGY